MDNRYFDISTLKKKETIALIADCLKKYPSLEFSYIHGSFMTENKFRDIDVAVYLKTMPFYPLQAELDLETDLMKVINKYPVEVRLLNGAPLSFRYNVIKSGKPLVVIDDDARSDFEESTLFHYFDFAPYRKMYMKETLGRGI